MKHEIKTKQAYHETMVDIYNLMNKGEANLKTSEIKKLAAMTVAAEKYEDEVLDLVPKKTPQSIPEIVEIKMADLPGEMRNMSVDQRKAYIRQKSEERTKIQDDIQSLNRKRLDYISRATPKGTKAQMLDRSMMKAIKQQGNAKKLIWEETNDVEQVIYVEEVEENKEGC